MSWIFLGACEAFAHYRDMWDEINRNQWNHILLDSKFVSPLIRYFATEGALLGISNDHQYPGMALVERIRHGFWRTIQPSQAPLGLILLGNRDNAVDQIEELMRSLPGYTVGFSVLQQDPDYTAFKGSKQCQTIEVSNYINTARISVIGSFADYWKRRGRRLVKDLARQRRRLQESGLQIELAIERDPGRVAECIRDYGRLEAIGWKARQGTAVTPDNPQGLFYRDMLEDFCRQGEGVIYRLLIGGRTAACELCIQRNGMLVDLKTTYDESMQGISPGSLLEEEMLKDYFSGGQIELVEFYGRVQDWTTKWTNEIRTMYHLDFYRHRWVAAARRFVKGSFVRLPYLGKE